MTFARGDFGSCQYDGRGLAMGGKTGMLARCSMIHSNSQMLDYSQASCEYISER